MSWGAQAGLEQLPLSPELALSAEKSTCIILGAQFSSSNLS